MATASTVPASGFANTSPSGGSSVRPEVFEPTEFTFNAELNEMFTQAVRTLGCTREEGMIWAVSLLGFAAQAKAEGKALGLALDPDVLDEQIVDF